MAIKFTCPEKKLTDDFSDAYAGLDFKCKHCGNYHTMPQKADFKRKDLLLTCPVTNSILAVDPSQEGHEFYCVACKGIHQIPDRNPVPGAPLADSVIFQKQTREAVIPSQRKQSPIKTPARSPALINTTKRRQAPKTNTARERAIQVDREPFDQKRDNPKKKKKISVLNVLITLIFVLAGIFLYFTITKVSTEKATQIEIQNLMLKAQQKLDKSDFNSAISIINEVQIKLEAQGFQITEPKYKKEIVENKKNEILKCQIAYNEIYDRFAPILSSNNLDMQTISKIEESLKLEIAPLRLNPELKPSANLLDKLVLQLKSKSIEIERKLIENIFITAEKYYNNGNYTEAFFNFSEGLSKIESQQPNESAKTKDALKNHISNFESRINNFAKANEIVKGTEKDNSKLNDAIKQLEELKDNLPSNDNTMRVIYNQFIQSIHIQKKIKEINQIVTIANINDEDKILELIKLLNSYTVSQYPATQKALNSISLLKKGLNFVNAETTTTNENNSNVLEKNNITIKEWANSLSKTLGQLGANEINVDVKNAHLRFKLKSQNWTVSANDSINGSKMIVEIDGIQIVYLEDLAQTLIKTQPQFLIKHASYLRSRIVSNHAPINKPWVITNGCYQLNLPCAFYLDDKTTLFLLDDQLFKINGFKPIYPNKSELHAELVEAKNELINTLATLKGTLEQKNTICELVETIVPLSSNEIIDRLAYKDILISKKFNNFTPNEKPILEALDKFYNNYSRLLLNSFEWFKGTDLNNEKITVEAYRILGDKISIRVYNSANVNTTLYYSFIPSLMSRNAPASYRFAFSANYPGNHKAAPTTEPFIINTYHSAFGKVAQYSPHDKKLVYNEKPWKEINGLDSNEENSEETKLTPHAILFDSKFQLDRLFLPNDSISTKELNTTPTWDEITNWLQNNKSKLLLHENLSTFIYYFTIDNVNLNKMNLKFVVGNQNQNQVSSYFYKDEHRIGGTAGSINRIIAKLNEEKQTPFLIAYENNTFANLWSDRILGKNYLFTHKNGILYKTLIQNEFRDIRNSLIRNFPSSYISPFKIPCAFFNEKGNYWSFANIASIYLRPDIQQTVRNKIINAMRQKCLLQIPEFITESKSKNLIGKELFDYFIYEEYGDFAAATKSLTQASESLKINNLFVTTIEKAQIESAFKHKKETAKNYQEIYKILQDSNLLENSSKSITDLRYHLAEIMAGLSKPDAASEILKYELNSTDKLNRHAMTTFANICFISSQLNQKNELEGALFKSFINPIQKRLNEEIEKEFLKPFINIESIFSLSQTKMLLAISQSDFDEVTGSLLAEPNFDNLTTSESFTPSESLIYVNHFRINGNIASASLKEWSKINPACFLFIVDQLLSDNFKENIKLDQKIKISMKFIEAFLNNLSKSKNIINLSYFTNEEIILRTLKNLYEQKFDDASKNISALYNSNKPIDSLIELMYPIIDQDDFNFNMLLDSFKSHEIPNLFYLDLVKKLYSKKSKQNFTSLVNFLQKKYQKDELILKEINILKAKLFASKLNENK